MRGVHSEELNEMSQAAGSSPHARGPLVRAYTASAAERFIPACAGSTKQVSGLCVIPWVHPRMRGVHFRDGSPVPFVQGSSPHARGPRYWSLLLSGCSRFIPACAGSTFFSK